MAGGRTATDRIVRGRFAISINDPGHPVPDGWQRVALTEVAELGTGHTPSRRHPEYWDGDIPWIGIRDAGAHHGGAIHDTAQHVTSLGLANSAARLLPKDTVCLSRTASVGYVVKMARPMATSQDFVTWTCSDALDPDYLKYALLAEGEGLRSFGEGSTHTTIYFPELKAFHIDLPPLSEQRRIVAALDRLTARLAGARTEVERSSKLSCRLLEKVQGAAFEGLAAPKFALADLVTDIRYGTAKKCEYHGGKTPVLRIPNVQGGLVDLVDLKSTDFEPNEKAKIALELGDILVIRSNGSRDLVGRSAVVRADAVGMAYAGYLIRLRPNSTKIDPDFLNHFLASPQTRSVIAGRARSTSGVNNVNAQQLLSLVVPLPTLERQRELVRAISVARERSQKLLVEAIRARTLVDRLEAALLSRAFRGELLPQDQADEPASALLERIRKERAVAPTTKRPRGRTPRAVSEAA